MTRLEAIRESKEHWIENRDSFKPPSKYIFNRDANGCALCSKYKNWAGGCSDNCPLVEMSEKCANRTSTWKQTFDEKPESCRAMIDVLTKCEEIELKRLEEEKMGKDKSAVPVRYVALCDGLGYVKGTIFALVNPEHFAKGLLPHAYYSPTDSFTPIFKVGELRDSINFERVKEYWEPEVGEKFIVILKHYEYRGYQLKLETLTRMQTDDADFYNPEIKDDAFIFGTPDKARACLDELEALAEKRSKESRRLGCK